MARQRDYKAERARRNERARSLGFSSMDALNRARKAGQYPTARQIQTDPQARIRAEQISFKRLSRSQQVPKRSKAAQVMRDYHKGIRTMRDESRRWSSSHSRREGTRFNDSWSDDRVAEYWLAFVQPAMLPDDERNLQLIYDYMEAYIDDFPEYEQDRGGYRGKHSA